MEMECSRSGKRQSVARILVQGPIYRRHRIGRDGHLDQSEAYDISQIAREYGLWTGFSRQLTKRLNKLHISTITDTEWW